MFSPNRAWHNRPNRTEDVPRPLWRSLPFAVRLQLTGMSTDPLLLHATNLPTDACLLPKSCSTEWALAAGHARSGIVLPASFVKFKGSEEVHGNICSKQHFPMGASPVFDDEDAYGLFAQFCMKLNVFTLVLSAIVWSCAFLPYNQFMDVLGTFGLACLITQLGVHHGQTNIVHRTAA